jgi:hypothetical protein
MVSAFEISYWWEKLKKTSYFVEMVDATRVFISLNYFLSIYEGEFTIHVQGHNACFNLRPDLSTIFEDIPIVLEKLTIDTESQVEFDFFEQGTDVGIIIERQGDKIQIRFDISPGSSPNFQFLPESKFTVPAEEFIEQWLRFIRAILNALVDLQPELLNDKSYQEYYTRLNNIDLYR